MVESREEGIAESILNLLSALSKIVQYIK